MSKPRVFPDTGALVAMIVFPHDHQGQISLGGEVLQLYEQGAFDLILSRAVVDELFVVNYTHIERRRNV